MAGKKVCPHAKKCGGCQLLNLSYPEQLLHKQRTVIRLLGKFCRVEDIIPSPQIYHYRNKAQYAFAVGAGGKTVSGVYQSSTHRVVAVSDCLLTSPVADSIVSTVKKLMQSFKIKPYNEKTGQGLIRHILIKNGIKSGEVMVVLVTASPVFPKKRAFVNALLSRHGEITTVVQNVNGAFTSMVLGGREEVLYGTGKIREQLCGLTFNISPKSFYQINPYATEILYGKALEFADFKGSENILDAYCGTGTIGLIASGGVKSVTGVEINPDAVKNARENARLNGIENAVFYAEDAGKFMVSAAKAGQKFDAVIMDPARAGCDKAFLSSLVKLAPEKAVYVSCNPQTLARDLLYLSKNGYKVKKIQPVDMFPHTDHVETVVQLVRKKPDTYIDITVDMDELDLTSSEAKATYEEIKDYIFDKHCVKVSSLYIAQIKQKHGIIERDCYNNSKKDNTKQPQCPPEKVKLIEEALRHFKMIS